MSFNVVPPQSHFFYDRKWTPEMDSIFLTSILEQKNETYCKDAGESCHAILSARGVVNSTFRCKLSWNDVQERVGHLETRYRVFKWITDNPHTHWDLQTNTITADDRVWNRLFKKNNIAQAYYYQGEPLFHQLAMCFGLDNVKVEPDHTVINISDSTLPQEDPENVVILDSDSEEVISPLAKNVPKMCQRLFDEYMDGRSKFPMQNAFPPSPKESRAKSDGSSSVASSSPR